MDCSKGDNEFVWSHIIQLLSDISLKNTISNNDLKLQTAVAYALH